MKEYEYVGVLITMVAYLLIVTENYTLGFQIGLLGNLALAVFAVTAAKKLFAILGLQMFFACANIYALLG